MPGFLIEEALKVQQWERAKGELRAMAALQGCYETDDFENRWLELEKRIEAFIKEMEDEGLVW